MERRDVLAARLANQRLTGPPADTPEQVVAELLCVQAQDAPLARAMIGYRTGRPVATVDAAVADGRLVRTHILRPTWHYVAAADLRWVLDLTAPRGGVPNARERQLGIDEAMIGHALDVVAERLAGGRYAVRRALGEALAEAAVLDRADPLFNQQVGHLLGFAEYRAVVCSAPVASPEHHYALVDEVIPAEAPRDRDDAITELVGRFVAGHGPVALRELQRWTPLTLVEIRGALERLGDRLARELVDGVELWSASGPGRPQARPQRACLLSVFDEAFLTYPLLNFPRSDGHPSAGVAYRFAEAGGGVVICDLRDVGTWKRRMVRTGVEVTLELDPGLAAGQRRAVDDAVERLRDTILG